MARERAAPAHADGSEASVPAAPPRASPVEERAALPVPATRTETPAASPTASGASAAAQHQLDLPPVALTLPAGSDLVLVETTHHAPPHEGESNDASRPRRMRPPKVSLQSEPLEIVETRKDGSSATQ